jgi:cell division protein FtsI/penicillin-binding protein 2
LLPDEQAGVVFAQTTDKHDEGALMQTAIGQRDVLLTPLQAANMVATILNDGELRAPRVVREIRYRNGQLRESFAPQVLRRGDAKLKEAAPVLRTWMRETVRSGTAQSLSQASVALAGKTGTAQVKLGGERAGEEVVNQWFVGYDVADERYAVAVVVEHMAPNDRQVALPIAMRVMNILTQDRIEQAP